MREKEILERAFAMPLTSPAYPPGPYRFVNREYLIITYRTDPEKLRAVVPEPLATVHLYGDVFGQIAVSAVVAAGVCFALSPLLVRWMHAEVEAES